MKSPPGLKSLGTGTLYLLQRQPSRTFYAENIHGERISLQTKDRATAEEMLHGHKAAVEKPKFAYRVAIAYLGDPIGPYLSHLTGQIPASK